MIDLDIKDDAFYSVKEIAEMIEKHPSTIKTWLQNKKLKGIKVGCRLWMVKGEELKKFFNGGQDE